MRYVVYTKQDDFSQIQEAVQVEADGFELVEVAGVAQAVFWNHGVPFVHSFRNPDAVICLGEKE